MYIIKIPKDNSQYIYVKNLLKTIMYEFDYCKFINFTESPLDEFDYSIYNGKFYREIKTSFDVNVDESKYINSYNLENMKNQGFTLQEYIEACLLFELEEIKVFPKQENQINEKPPILTILICPDGLDEIQVLGHKILIDRIIKLFNQI